MKLKNICIIFLLFMVISSIFYYLNVIRDQNSCLGTNINAKIAFKDSPNCYVKLYDKLIPHFLVYDAKINSEPLKFIRLGKNSMIYIVPKYALEKADALIGYGIFKNITFEEQFANLYNKNSYGYDCGVDKVAISNKRCHFESECIGTDKFILEKLGQISSKRIHSFGQNLTKIGLMGKPVFVKMDISGAEVEVMDDILKYSDQITGIALVIHCEDVGRIINTLKMLKEIDKHFILVSRQTHIKVAKYVKFKSPRGRGYFSTTMSLTYINKNLVDEYKIADNQDSSKQQWEGYRDDEIPTNIIKWKVLPDIIWKTITNHKK